MDRSVTGYVTIHLFGLSEDGSRSTHIETKFDNFAPGNIITPDISNESFENV
jgi:hypothetical protein